MKTMHEVAAYRLDEMSDKLQNSMFRLRHDAFHTRLGWDVNSENNLERDEFDQADTHYVISNSAADGVVACCRLLPTTGKTMIRDIFPELLHGLPAPNDPSTWEICRLALASDRLQVCSQPTFSSFGPITIELFAEIARFALKNKITRYIVVTTVSVERLMKRLRLNVYRAGPPIRFGDCIAVACMIEVDHTTLNAVGVKADFV